MDALLDANEVTKLLGVSRRTLESLLARAEGPAYLSIGRQRRWRPVDVDRWVELQLKVRPDSRKHQNHPELKGQEVM